MKIYKKKRILVTGSSGFIGTNLIKKLVKYDVKIIAVIHKKLPQIKLMSPEKRLQKMLSVFRVKLYNFSPLSTLLNTFNKSEYLLHNKDMEAIYPKTNYDLWKYADMVGTEAIEKVKVAINLSEDAIMFGFDTATVLNDTVLFISIVKGNFFNKPSRC